ncbi:MAG: membrane-associated phospholipid phosphatase [Bacteroidia bacterium]|jgi:membrane-associated phospholipid phosphatase
MKRIFLLVIAVFVAIQSNAQDDSYPYEFNWKKDAYVSAIGLGLIGGGGYMYLNKTGLSLSELNALSIYDINAFDRSAVDRWSPTAAKISDGLMYGALALPFTIFAFKSAQENWLGLSLMYVEVALYTVGVTELTKGLSKRVRPYAYNPEAPLDTRLGKSGRFSFFSGHTSIAASMSFLTAKVFHDLSDNNTAKALVWTAAALIPAATGYLRYHSGKHFPTDIIAGYVVGGAIGYLVPFLHKKKLTNENLSLMPVAGPDNLGLYVSYRW